MNRLDHALTYRLHLLNKLTDRASHDLYLRETGLPIGEARCLASIGSFEPLSVNDLALHACLNKGQASRAAQALVDRGLVSKTTRDTDARGVVLTLTPTGHATWSQVMALIGQRNDDIFGCLSDDERALLGSLFDRLIANARTHAPTSQSSQAV
jgi:DNA-binding MarR family transcriptional regulator